MNDTQRQQIEKLRAEGLSYGKISDALGLSTNNLRVRCRDLEQSCAGSDCKGKR